MLTLANGASDVDVDALGEPVPVNNKFNSTIDGWEKV